MAQEAVADLEKNKKELESGLGKKEKEITALNSKLEDEQALVAKLQKQIKEQQVRSFFYFPAPLIESVIITC